MARQIPRQSCSVVLLLVSVAAAMAMAAWASPQKADPKPTNQAAENRGNEKPAPAPAEKVVLKIADEQVTDAELNFFMRNMRGPQPTDPQTRRNAAEQLALILVLYKQALADHLEASPDFEREMTQWRHRWLAQSEYQNLAKKIQVTPEEIQQNYSSRRADFELVKMRQFSVRKRPETVKEGGAGLSSQGARARLEEIRKAVGAGGEVKQITKDFAAAGQVFIDQEPRPVRRGQLFAALDKAAFELKDGELSEIVETPASLQFIQIVGHQRRELSEVSGEIDRQLRQKKLNETVEALKKSANIWMDPEYFGPPPGAPEAKPARAPASSPAGSQTQKASPAPEQSAPATLPKPAAGKRPPEL